MQYKYRELVETARKGDKQATEELIENLKPLLLSSIKRCGWRLDREELKQEAALSVIEGIQEFDESKNVPFLAFIKSKVYFHIYNLSKKQKVTYSLDSNIDTDDGQSFMDLIEDERPGPEDETLTKEMYKLLKDNISVLPPRQRLVIALYYFRGFSLQNIADLLAVSYRTASRIKKNALYNLSNNLKDYDINI